MTEVLDGRLARGARTRAAVIDALLALHEAGDLSPTAQRVATRAGVSLRSVYIHFADMEALYAEAADREFERMVQRARLVPADLPLQERLDRFAHSRCTVLEWLAPVTRAAALREHASPVLRGSRARFIASGDDEVRAVFATELSAARDRERLVLLVHLVASSPAWEALRSDRGLSVRAAEHVLHAGLAAVLQPESEPPCP